MRATKPGLGFLRRWVLGACALAALCGPASAQPPPLPASHAEPDPARAPDVEHVFRGVNDAQGKAILDQVFAFLDATIGSKSAR